MGKLEHLKANRKKIAPVIVLVIVCSTLLFLLTKGEYYTGIAEALIITNPAEISGKIISANISLGQEVNAGDILVVIDSKDLEYALEQLELSLEKARILHSDARRGQGSRTESNIAGAQAAYDGAAAVASQANREYQRTLGLYQSGAVSESVFEAAKLQRDTAETALSAARAQLSLARNSSADSVSESSNVDILLLRSRIAQQKDMIEKCTITAGISGTIISKNYSAGDYIAPGYDIVDIASKDERYLVVYYPKEKLTDIVYDARHTFMYGGSEYTGTVKFIDVKPVYTPQDYQTPANKNKESVKVKVLIPENCPIKPGESARVRFSRPAKNSQPAK
jgi:HlyD family secretion protein